MVIKQIVNNNVVVSTDANGEIIVIGKGIGFNGKVGQEIDDSLVEKTFVLQNETVTNDLKMLLEEIPYEIIKFGIKAVDYTVKCLNKKISRRILIPLIDHIYSCLEREKEGIKFDTALKLNVSFLYRDEYIIAEDIVDMLNSDFNTNVDKEEAMFIALHIVNSEMDIDLKDTYIATDIIDISVNAIEECFGIKLNNDDINFARLITHLQFFAKRMIKETFVEDDIEDINKHINVKYPKEYECAKLIGKKINEKYNCQVDENEYSYLTIHIARLLK